MKNLVRTIAILCLFIAPAAAFAIYNPYYEQIAKAFSDTQKLLEESRNLCRLALTPVGYDELAKSLLKADKTLREIRTIALGYQYDRIDQALEYIKNARFIALADRNTEAAGVILDNALKIMQKLIFDNMVLE